MTTDTNTTDTARRRIWDFTWHRGKSHLDLWYTDDDNRQANWNKAHGLYVTGRDLSPKAYPAGSGKKPMDPYLWTLQEVMDVMQMTWFHDNARIGDIFWLNAEQIHLKWSIGDNGQWPWFALMMRQGFSRMDPLGHHGSEAMQYFDIYDTQYSYLHKYTHNTIAIEGLYANEHLMTLVDRLTRSTLKHKIALVSTTNSSRHEFTETVKLALGIPGCDVGLWAGPELKSGEHEGLQWGAEEIERRLGYRSDATGAGGATT